MSLSPVNAHLLHFLTLHILHFIDKYFNLHLCNIVILHLIKVQKKEQDTLKQHSAY